MVMRLRQPMVDNDAYLDQVVNERLGGTNANFFEDIREEWKQKVRDYLEHGGNPEIVKPWEKIAAHSTRFKTLYLSPGPTSHQAPILKKLRSKDLHLCPICGEDGAPNTLDHYLPKEEYPEFSITPHNLVPACDTCQGAKLAQLLDEASKRIFLHPYFDTFLDEQVVRLRINPPFDAPDLIDLHPADVLTPDQAELVRRHLEKLHIPQRFYKYFRGQYLRLLRLCFRMRSRGENIRNGLEYFSFNSESKGPNSWENIFYGGIREDNALMDYLQNGDLPLNL